MAASQSNLADLEQALVNADAAGDTEAATTLAQEITRQRAASTEDQPALVKLNAAMSAHLPDFVNKVADAAGQPASGVLEGIAGMLNLPGSIVRAVGEKLGIDPSNLPMTTDEIKQAGVKYGVTAPEPTSAPGRISRLAGEQLGASAVPAAGVLGAAAKGAEGITGFKAAVAAAKTAPVKFAATEAGSAIGSGVGAGTAKEIAPQSKGAEVVGTLIGSMAPTAAAGSVRALVRGGEATRQTMERSIKEFGDAGMTPTVGMAVQRRFNQAIESGLSIYPGASGRMAAYSEKTAQQLYKRVDNITAGISPIRSPDTAGVAIKNGVADFVSRFKNTWRNLDAKVAVPPTAAIPAPETRAAMVKLGDPVNMAAYPQLAKIAERLDTISRGGAMSYGDMRTFRSSIGGLIPESYAANLPQGQLKQLYAAMSTDLRNYLQATDKTALAAFERSNQYYGAAMTRLDQSLAPLTSHDIPERVFLALERSGHAGRTVINAAKRSIGQDNWDMVAGTILQRMGKAPAGAQNAATDAFSAGTFLTNWAKYDKRALKSLLQGTSGGSQFVDDVNAIAKAAERIRDAGRVFSNPSGTARAIANVNLGLGATTAALTLNLHAAGLVLGTAGLANMSARAFTNPKFVHFLAQSTRVPAQRLPGLVSRLGNSLASEPEDVQVEIANYLNRLSDAFSAQPDQKQ